MPALPCRNCPDSSINSADYGDFAYGSGPARPIIVNEGAGEAPPS
jgi:hypothetical protein